MFSQPMGIEEFSFVYATALAVVAVGVVALLFGQCMMMGRIGRHWWQGLIPGYNLYLLFCGARLQVLFLLYLACAVGCFGLWMVEEPEVQDLIWIPIALGVLIIMYVSLALAQRMHLGVGWQIAAFCVPSYAWVLMGLTGARVDEDWYPWTVRPFIRFEHLIFRNRAWEFDRKTGKPFELEDEELAKGEEFELEVEPMSEPEPAQAGETSAPETTPVPLGEDAGISAPEEAPASPETEVETMSETEHEPVKDEEPQASEPAYEGGEFDPVGDEAAEAAADEGADREIVDFVDEEAELADAAEAKGGVQDDDLSDEVNSRLEGIYAEELGFPGVTQAVDDEEAVYMESDASIAREEILEEEHDEPDPNGYQARHLAEVAEEFEDEEKARKAAEDAEFEKEKASYEARHLPRHGTVEPAHKPKPKPKHARD